MKQQEESWRKVVYWGFIYILSPPLFSLLLLLLPSPLPSLTLTHTLTPLSLALERVQKWDTVKVPDLAAEEEKITQILASGAPVSNSNYSPQLSARPTSPSPYETSTSYATEAEPQDERSNVLQGVWLSFIRTSNVTWISFVFCCISRPVHWPNFPCSDQNDCQHTPPCPSKQQPNQQPK